MSVWRFDPDRLSGRLLDIDVPLGRLDMMQLYGRLPDTRSRDGVPEVGIRKLQTSSRELARERNVDFHPGVIVLELTSGSRLADELPPGSTIVEVMDQPVESLEEFLGALRGRDFRPPFGVKVTAILPDGAVRAIRLLADD